VIVISNDYTKTDAKEQKHHIFDALLGVAVNKGKGREKTQCLSSSLQERIEKKEKISERS
jgi:hypothetical protein